VQGWEKEGRRGTLQPHTRYTLAAQPEHQSTEQHESTEDAIEAKEHRTGTNQTSAATRIIKTCWLRNFHAHVLYRFRKCQAHKFILLKRSNRVIQ
jgi:hypothetical protein